MIESWTNRVKNNSSKKFREVREDDNRTIIRNNFWITGFKDLSNGTNFVSSGEHSKVLGFLIKEKVVTSLILNKKSPCMPSG